MERGISVSTDMSYLVLGAYDYFYVVSGKVIGYGSDGEPLLDAATMEKHSPYKSISCYCKKADRRQKEKEEKFLEAYGWTAEDLHNLMYRPLACKRQYINVDGEIADWRQLGSNQQKIFTDGEFESWQNRDECMEQHKPIIENDYV